MVTSVCQFIRLLLVYLGAKETVVVTENASLSEENCSVVEMLSHPGVQHVLVEESRSVSGDWVHDVMRTGEDSWQPLVVVMVCSVTCVTSALIQATRREQELGTHSAFGMTSRWLLMTSGRENLQSHLNVTNITMDNVAMFDTQLMRQSAHRRQRRRSTHFIQTLMWTRSSRYWTPVDPVASHTKHSSADHQDTFLSAWKEGTPDLENSLFPNIRHGYNGRRLRVLIKEWMSFVMVCDESGQRVWCGLLLDLLQVASTTLNFTYVAVNASSDEWGTGESDTANVGFYGRIFRQEADIGLTPTDIILERASVLDFSDPFMFSSVVMVYRKPEVTPHRWVLFNPLSAQTIAAIVGSLVSVTLLVCGLEMMVEGLRGESVGIEERNPRERRRHSLRDWILTLDRALQVSGAAILSEASELQLRSRPARVLLCSWWLLSVVMAAAYSGTLTAFLSATKHTQLFSSLEDLVTKQHDYKWGTVVVTSIFLILQPMKNLEMKIKNQSESKGRFHNMTVLGVDSTLVSDSPEEILCEGTTEQTMGATATSLDTDIDESVNCGVQSQRGNVVLMYGLPSGAGNPNFGWRSTQGGYQARFRATRNGRICGHDSGIIPGHVYSSLGSASHGESGRSYRVTMSSGGQDLSSYF